MDEILSLRDERWKYKKDSQKDKYKNIYKLIRPKIRTAKNE